MNKTNILKPVNDVQSKVNESDNLGGYLKTLSVCTGESYGSNSSLVSSSSIKTGSPIRLNSKRDSAKHDVGLISATTSPYRCEWENRNKPFCRRFFPLPLDRRKIENNELTTVLPYGKNENSLPINSERLPASVIGLNPISPRTTEQLINIREAEKDRLAQIFAFSSPLKRHDIHCDFKKSDLEKLIVENQVHFSPLSNFGLPSRSPNKNIGTVNLPNVDQSSKAVATTNISTVENESCNTNYQGFGSSSQKEKRLVSDKEVQTNIKNITTLIQETVFQPLDQRKENVSPFLEGHCYLDKEVQTNYDTQCNLNTFKQNSIYAKGHFTNEEVLDAHIHKKQISTPERFEPASLKTEDNIVNFIPLPVISSPNTKNKRMVRIGEFSPLNPKLNSPGQALLGLGEYEERRKMLLEQRKHEYCQYLEQARLAAKSNQELKQSDHEDSDSTNMKEVSTQTDSSRNYSSFMSPKKDAFLTQDENKPLYDAHGSIYDSEDGAKISGLSNIQLKQFLYREELRKQIEERQKIEAEKREKERLEEEAMEAKIRQQQEEMQIRYEAEVAEKMELALKKKQQEEALHHRLVEMQQQAQNEKQLQWKLRKDLAVLSPRNDQEENCRQLSNREDLVMSYSTQKSIPLNRYHHDKEKIYKESIDSEKQYSGLRKNKMHRDSPGIGKQKISKRDSKDRAFTVIEVDDPKSRMADHYAAAENILRKPLIEAIPPHPSSSKSTPSRTNATVLRHAAEDILRQPLLLSPEDDVIRNVRDSIPLLPRSDSPPIPAAATRARTNAETLDDKWQIPVVEKYLMTPLDVLSHNNRSVLTQLGAFRKQLQQEKMRMALESKSSDMKS